MLSGSRLKGKHRTMACPWLRHRGVQITAVTNFSRMFITQKCTHYHVKKLPGNDILGNQILVVPPKQPFKIEVFSKIITVGLSGHISGSLPLQHQKGSFSGLAVGVIQIKLWSGLFSPSFFPLNRQTKRQLKFTVSKATFYYKIQK